MKRNLKSKRIQDAVNRFLNKDLKNRQSFMRVVDSEGRIKENVIFRVEDDGNILSVFPNTYGNADRSRDTMVCADSKGHSVCTYDYVEEYTRAADAAEYEALYNQLTDSVGYSLTVLDKLPTRTELAKVRDNFIKAYRDECKKKLADSMQQIDDARALNRGDEIFYKGKKGTVQYALFHGQEPVVIRWQNEDGSEEFEVPYNEVGDLKVKDSKISDSQNLAGLINDVDNMLHYHNKNLNNSQYTTIEDLLLALESKDTEKIKKSIDEVYTMLHYNSKNLRNNQYAMLDDLISALKVEYLADSVNEKPQADNKVKDDDESAEENVDENTDIEEGDEVADGCGKKKTKDSKVNIFKRKTTKKA